MIYTDKSNLCEVSKVQQETHTQSSISPVDDFRAQSSLGYQLEQFRIGEVDGKCVGDGVEMLKRRLGRHFVTVGDADGMNPAIEQLFRVLQKSAGENDDSGRPVAWKQCKDAENRVRESKTSLVN